MRSANWYTTKCEPEIIWRNILYLSQVLGMITRKTLARYRARICCGTVDFVELPLGGHGVELWYCPLRYPCPNPLSFLFKYSMNELLVIVYAHTWTQKKRRHFAIMDFLKKRNLKILTWHFLRYEIGPIVIVHAIISSVNVYHHGPIYDLDCLIDLILSLTLSHTHSTPRFRVSINSPLCRVI